jgi:peptidoglycan LD-endopeptidase LytH
MRSTQLVGDRVSRRRVGGTLLAMALVATLVPARSAEATTSDQVAAEILRVQAKADKTAKLWSDAQIRQQDVVAQIQTSQAQIAVTSAQYEDLQSGLARIAIDRFTRGAAPPILLVGGDLTETMQVNELKNVALDAGASDLDTIDAARTDLQGQQSHLDELQAQNTKLVAELATRQTQIDAQLADLATLREQLKNEEVKRAYDAQLAKQKKDEANAAADRDAKAADQRPLTASPALAAIASSSIAPRGGGVNTPPPALPTGPSSTEPAPSTEPPATDPAPTVIGGSFICPVAGPNAFGDTFGAPRPGGRKHEGVDMMSPYGTPLVAVVAGVASMRTTPLGGNSISLAGDNGNRYFYAHLSSWEGSSRTVAAGEVIGYVGHTGDTTANHLHFEIHPGGGAAVDPYPTVRKFC